MARGFFGGSIFRDSLSARSPGVASLVQYPVLQRLAIDRSAVEDAIGKDLASRIRRRLKAGRQEGGPLPSTKPRGEDGETRPMLKATGKLISSIKYNRKTGRIEASGIRNDGHKPTRRVRNSNYALLAVHIAERGIDPLGTEEFQAEVQRVAEEEIAKQLARGGVGIVHELRRVRR